MKLAFKVFIICLSSLVFAPKVLAQATPPSPSFCADLKKLIDFQLGIINTYQNRPDSLSKTITEIARTQLASLQAFNIQSGCATVLFECIVRNSTNTANVSLGVLNLGAEFTNNTAFAQKPACMSSNACLNIVPQKFLVIGTLQSARCNPPDATVVPLTDVEVQIKINAIP